MRQIFNIFINDLRAVGRQFFAIVIMLAICILPALYAWFNIYANTDPYGSTKNIAIAVASDDPGVTLDDGSYVNMAQEVMDDLAAKTTIHWIVTDSVQEAIDGVYAGDTYAAVILSEDFTARMTDLSTAVSSGGAGMTYYENGKKNAVASKITQTAVTSLQQDVRAKYLGNLFSQLYSDTTELTGSANIAQAAGQVSQHIAALGAKLRTYSNVIGNILGDSVALDQLTQGGGLTFEGADTWQQQIENSTALLSQVQEQSGQAASALMGSLEDLESALQQAAKGDQAALTDAAQAAKDAQTKVQNIRSVLAHLSRLDGVSQTLTLLDTAELHLQQIRTVIEDKAVSNEQIETCLEAMPSLEKLAAGEIRADLEQIAGGVKNAATDVQPLLKAMETMKQDIVPAIDAVQGSKDDAVAALGCLQVVLGGLADRMDELSKLAAACSSSDLLHQLDTALSGDASRFGAFLAGLSDPQLRLGHGAVLLGAGHLGGRHYPGGLDTGPSGPEKVPHGHGQPVLFWPSAPVFAHRTAPGCGYCAGGHLPAEVPVSAPGDAVFGGGAGLVHLRDTDLLPYRLLRGHRQGYCGGGDGGADRRVLRLLSH